jgi:hypothetical protein
MSERIECPCCGWEVEVAGAGEGDAAHVLYGEEAGEMVPGARDLRFGEQAVLHHICSHPQIGEATEVERRDAWWACLEPEREPDEHLHHDLNCAACAKRWIASRVN